MGRERKKPLRHPSQVPSKDMSRSEKIAFWKNHEITKEYLEKLEPAPENTLPPPSSRSISIRFDEDVLQRLKIVARRKFKPYQSLLKEFVLQRLFQEEEREKLVSPPTFREGIVQEGTDQSAGEPSFLDISILVEEDILQRLKVLAQKKYTSYQTLLKEFIIEGLGREEAAKSGVIDAQSLEVLPRILEQLEVYGSTLAEIQNRLAGYEEKLIALRRIPEELEGYRSAIEDIQRRLAGREEEPTAISHRPGNHESHGIPESEAFLRYRFMTPYSFPVEGYPVIWQTPSLHQLVSPEKRKRNEVSAVEIKNPEPQETEAEDVSTIIISPEQRPYPSPQHPETVVGPKKG
jgi:hypothetical protein